MKLQDILYEQRKLSKDFKNQWIQSMSLDLKDYLNKYSKQDLIIKIPELFQPGRYYNLLNNLWTKGFNLGDSINNSTTFSLSDSLLDLVNFAEKDTRRRKMKGEYIASSQGIETTDFGKLYLKYRNQEIFSNFIPQYRQTIKYSIKKYIESPKPDESALYNGLKPQYIKDKTPQELTDYVKVKSTDKEFMESQGLKVNDMGGLLKKNKENPDIYDKTGYYLDLDNRVDRIAQTEISQAYNLGVIAKSVEKGNTLFMWNNSLEISTLSRCKLCASLFGKIVDLGSSIIGSYQGWNMDFKKLPSGYTRKTIFELPELKDNIAPVAHPNCYCFLTVLDNKETVTKYYSAITGNKTNSKELVNKVLSSVGMQSEEQKTKEDKSLLKNLLSAALIGTVAVKGVDVAKQLSYDLVLEHKKKEEQRRKQKMIIIGSSILATGMMMYFFYKTNAKLKSNILDDIVEEIVPTEKLGAKITRTIDAGIEVSKETADELSETIVDEIAEEFTESVEESMEKLELEALYERTKTWINGATNYLIKTANKLTPYTQITQDALNSWDTLITTLQLREIESNPVSKISILRDDLTLDTLNVQQLHDTFISQGRREELKDILKIIRNYRYLFKDLNKEFKRIDTNIKQLRLKIVPRNKELLQRIEICRIKFDADDKRLEELELLYSRYKDVRTSIDNTYFRVKDLVVTELELYRIVVKDKEDLHLEELIEQDDKLLRSLNSAINKLTQAGVQL